MLNYLSQDNSEVMLCIKTNRKGTNESLRSSKSVGKAPMKVMFNQIYGYFCIFHISRNFFWVHLQNSLLWVSFHCFQVLSFLNERIYHRCSFETAGSCLLKYKFFMTFIVAFWWQLCEASILRKMSVVDVVCLVMAWPTFKVALCN